MGFLFVNNKMQASPDFNPASLPPPMRRVITPVKADLSDTSAGHSICLTFDDGPDPAYTPKILDMLADYNAKATFFVVGEAASRLPHLVEQIINAGHAIGNHTYSHRHPWLMSAEHAKQEVWLANKVIKDITGSTPRWFRPPFGRLRTAMREQAHAEQMMTVLWSRSVIDWGVFGTKAGISRRLNNIVAGDIVLLHDGRPEHNRPGLTYQCLPQFLRRLADKSLIAHSLDEIFGEKK